MKYVSELVLSLSLFSLSFQCVVPLRIKVLPTLSSLPADRLKREELLASSQEERTEEGKVVLPSRLQELEVALAALAVLFAAPASSELNATLGLQTTFDEVDLIRFLFGW